MAVHIPSSSCHKRHTEALQHLSTLFSGGSRGGTLGSDHPSLLSDQTEAFFFLETGPPPPPPNLGSEWSTSALISRSGSVTALRVTYYILYHSKTVLNEKTFFFLYKIWVPTSSWGSSDSPNDLASSGLRFPFLFCQKIMKQYSPS